jgi:hypothetical protein
MTEDKLFSEYTYFTEGKKYTTYQDYLKPRGLSKFRSVLQGKGQRPMHEYIIIDLKQFMLTKIKYGM